MNTFSLTVIASDKVFFEGRAENVIIPALDGEQGILAHHENMVIAVDFGEMRIHAEDGQWIHAIVGSGFASVMNNRVTVLVETAERPEDIDVKRAEEAKKRAEEHMRQKKSIQEYYHSQASLARAMSRLKITSKYQ